MAAVVFLTAFLVRAPLISAGLPYLYREDDTHHFNRTVEMVKRRDLNPYYFHKPSLHFYVRMPVVWATVQWLIYRGEIASIKEVRTRDPYGLAGYNFTASHSLVVETNRFLSILMSLATILISMLLAYRFGVSAALTALCGLIVAFSPEFLVNSPIVGVDILMALLTVLTSWVALEVYRNYTHGRLYALAFLSGLAISSKYNAAPIAALPFLIAIVRRDFSFVAWIASGLLVVAGFFLGSPYILVSIPEFVEQLSYEVWHYRVAGHQGHSAEPGIEQAVFYFKWLIADGVGLIATLLAAVGAVASIRQRPREAIIILSFPVLFTILMIFQRANFTRNMVPVIPYAAICAAIGLHWMLSCCRRFRFFIGIAFSCAAVLPIGLMSCRIAALEHFAPESRRKVVEWITHSTVKGDIAVSGQLLLPIKTFSLPGVDAFDPRKTAVSKLVLAGYTFFVLPAATPPDPTSKELLNLVNNFQGDSEFERIVKNPTVEIYSFDVRTLTTLLKFDGVPAMEMVVRAVGDGTPSCRDGEEQYCWLNSRMTKLLFASEANAAHSKITFEMMSPWTTQEVTVFSKGKIVGQWIPKAAGQWASVTVDMEENWALSDVFIYSSEVHSPQALGLSEDSRRLGVAVRRVVRG